MPVLFLQHASLELPFCVSSCLSAPKAFGFGGKLYDAGCVVLHVVLPVSPVLASDCLALLVFTLYVAHHCSHAVVQA